MICWMGSEALALVRSSRVSSLSFLLQYESWKSVTGLSLDAMLLRI